MKWHENRELAEKRLAEIDSKMDDLVMERTYIKQCLEHNMDCIFQCDCGKYFETWGDFTEHTAECDYGGEE